MAARHDLIRLRRTNGFMVLHLAVGSVTKYRAAAFLPRLAQRLGKGESFIDAYPEVKLLVRDETEFEKSRA